MPLDLEQIADLQALKTGALFVWAAELGAHPRRAPTREPLARYGAALGLRLPDRATTSSTSRAIPEAAGKRLGKDEARGKATFVSLLGLDGARAQGARAWSPRPATRSRPTARRRRTSALAAQFALARGR